MCLYCHCAFKYFCFFYSLTSFLCHFLFYYHFSKKKSFAFAMKMWSCFIVKVWEGDDAVKGLQLLKSDHQTHLMAAFDSQHVNFVKLSIIDSTASYFLHGLHHLWLQQLPNHLGLKFLKLYYASCSIIFNFKILLLII